MRDGRPWAFIAWAPYGRRSESLARELGARMHFIHYLKFQRPVYAPLKYLLQALHTAWVLLRQRPPVVFVQNPPFVCALVVRVHCFLFGGRCVLDHHSDAFSARWRWALPIQKQLARAAVSNVVTNEHWVDTLREWGAEGFILEDALPAFPAAPARELKPGFNVVFINTFAEDEPLDEVIAAARGLSGVNVYVTGRKDRKPESFYADLPPAVIFTDFLPDEEYLALLVAADAVMALTTRDFTLQGGGFEAVALGKPLITSHWPYLQRLFARGSIYVDNEREGIRNGLERMRAEAPRLALEMRDYEAEKRRQWRERFEALRAIIRGDSSTA